MIKALLAGLVFGVSIQAIHAMNPFESNTSTGKLYKKISKNLSKNPQFSRVYSMKKEELTSSTHEDLEVWGRWDLTPDKTDYFPDYVRNSLDPNILKSQRNDVEEQHPQRKSPLKKTCPPKNVFDHLKGDYYKEKNEERESNRLLKEIIKDLRGEFYCRAKPRDLARIKFVLGQEHKKLSDKQLTEKLKQKIGTQALMTVNVDELVDRMHIKKMANDYPKTKKTLAKKEVVPFKNKVIHNYLMSSKPLNEAKKEQPYSFKPEIHKLTEQKRKALQLKTSHFSKVEPLVRREIKAPIINPLSKDSEKKKTNEEKMIRHMVRKGYF